MRKTRILSSFRTEYRRTQASYQSEIAALRWVRRFLNEFSIDHSSQIRPWQMDYFISNQKKSHTYVEVLQAKSALQFLLNRVLHQHFNPDFDAENDSSVIISGTG